MGLPGLLGVLPEVQSGNNPMANGELIAYSLFMHTSTQSAPQPLRILLVEDNVTFASSVKDYLLQVPKVRVIGHAVNGPQAISQCLSLHPQLMLMDIGLHGMTGFEIADLVLGLERPPAVVFLSMYDDDIYRSKATKMGACGFVSKSEFTDTLLPLLNTIVNRAMCA